jgi:hypothetical protein
MKTPIHLNGKGNEVIARGSFSIGSCFYWVTIVATFVMIIGARCTTSMQSWINKDIVHQSMKIIFSYKNIHLSSSVAKEKVGNIPLNMCSVFQGNNCNNIPKCVMGCCMFIPTRVMKQMHT